MSFRRKIHRKIIDIIRTKILDQRTKIYKHEFKEFPKILNFIVEIHLKNTHLLAIPWIL